MPTDCPRWSSDLRDEPFFSIALNRKRTSLVSSPRGIRRKQSAFAQARFHTAWVKRRYLLITGLGQLYTQQRT
jgi:hypothetical protein